MKETMTQSSRQPKVKMTWTNHLKSPQDKTSFEQLLRNHYSSDKVFKRQIEIIKYRRDSIYKEMVKKVDPADTSWPMRQAQLTGRLHELENLLSLFDLDQKEEEHD